MILLGIESSCDDTSAAVSDDWRVISNVTASQHEHDAWGGIVPELASRAHDRKITDTVERALEQAGIGLQQVDAVAVTMGPGLIGSLLVGATFARGLAVSLGVPVLGVDHIDAHMYAGFMDSAEEAYRFLVVVVSGGHNRLVVVEAPLRHRLLGQTRDDAAGEAFDKSGKLMGLGYPAGPIIDRLAEQGDPRRFVFPQALKGEGFEFSFSGLKTSVRYRLEGMTPEQVLASREDLAAGVREAITQILIHKLRAAVRQTGIRNVVVSGGVSANRRLRQLAADMAREEGVSLRIPPLEYCTDNAGMICRMAWIQHREGRVTAVDAVPYARRSEP